MVFQVRGKLCGYLCGDCRELLSGVTVRLYRNRKDQNTVGLAVANPKDTLAILDDKAVEAKASSLLGEVQTAADGTFSIDLGPNQKYDGGPFEIDIYCGTVPHRKPTRIPPKPLQFSITTIQPAWKTKEDIAVAYWEYCLPARFWCGIRQRFGAWTICGHVVDCKSPNKSPVAGVIVSAFDTDWIQDDSLGSAVTDASGHFRIDYSTIDFQRTPFFGLNVELFGGPDLYFKVTTSGGTVILQEPSSRGRQSDRENAGPCFCVELCVDQPVQTKHAWFTHVGDFNINTDIDPSTGKTNKAAPTGSGAHGGPGFGFYDGLSGYGMQLIGDCPTTHPAGGDPMRYRFRYANPSTSATLQPISGANISSQLIGTRDVPWDFGSGLTTTFQDIVLVPSGGSLIPLPLPTIPAGGDPAGPPPALMMPDTDGWVIVDPLATNGTLSGPLMKFVSSSVVPGGSAVTAGDSAGNPPSSPKNGTAIRIVFEAEPVTGASATSPLLTNALPKILINNWQQVLLLDLVQFGTSCCTPLTSALGIEYTTDHELMRSWGLGISSCATFPFTPLSGPTAAKPRGDNGTDNVDISTWPGCSYLISLSATRALTDGLQDDPGANTVKTFCIDR
jgi:hypothetical protein